jgi:hypothetical protein
MPRTAREIIEQAEALGTGLNVTNPEKRTFAMRHHFAGFRRPSSVVLLQSLSLLRLSRPGGRSEIPAALFPIG